MADEGHTRWDGGRGSEPSRGEARPTDRRRRDARFVPSVFRGMARGPAVLAPVALACAALAGWEWAVGHWETPSYVLPAPSDVVASLRDNWATLAPAWLVTLRTMGIALAAAIVGGVLLAALFTLSPALELSLFPYAVVLQVTPLVAIAPLLMVWTDQTWLVLLLCAWIVAFFPILAGTTVGLRAIDPGLRDLFDLYGATRLQHLRLLAAPTALPYFLAGLRTAVNLSLVGAVVAEFVTGAGGAESGLAAAVFEGQYRSDTPRMFAALGLISVTGVVCYFATHVASVVALRSRGGEA